MALSSKMEDGDELHIITTHPNRYLSHRAEADDIEVDGRLKIYRIEVPSHRSGMFTQASTFGV
jgi:hypothetical protein